MSPRRLIWIVLVALYSLSSWQLLLALENGTALSSALQFRSRLCVPFIIAGFFVGTFITCGKQLLCPCHLHPAVTSPSTTNFQADAATTISSHLLMKLSVLYLTLISPIILFLLYTILKALFCPSEDLKATHRQSSTKNKSTTTVHSITEKQMIKTTSSSQVKPTSSTTGAV